MALDGQVFGDPGQRRRQIRALMATDKGNAWKDQRGGGFGHGHD
jgi:hypothetical protein